MERRLLHVSHVEIVEQLAEAIERDTRIAARPHDIRIARLDHVLRLEGEVPDIAAKRRACAHALACPGIQVIDRIRVLPDEPMADGLIRVHVVDSLLEDTAFGDCTLRFERDGEVVVAREAIIFPHGSVCVHVADGEVTLEGNVPSLAHDRLAGVLAWWVPGTRNVVDDLLVSPPEEDSDEEITEAVRLALEKDPLVDAAQVAVTTRGRVVTLTGTLASDVQRHACERDAWYVNGVLDVGFAA
jgi:osmotically-inducible protein OsmY